MTRVRSLLPWCLWGGLVAAPVGFAFHEALLGSPRGLRLLLAGLAMGLVMLAGPMLRHGLRSLGSVGGWLLGATLAFGLGLFALTEPTLTTADFAEVGYSDGSRKAGVKPAPIVASGRAVPAYGMHPAYDTAVVADSLVATFSSRPREITLLFAKSPDVLFQPDGRPNDSDGVSVHVRAYDAQGTPGPSQTFDLAQGEFLPGKWIERRLVSASGIASVQLSLATGPPGSTASYDSTFVGFAVPDARARAGQAARVVLLSLGFGVVALVLALNLSAWMAHARRRRGDMLPAMVQVALVLAGLLLLAYWSQSQTSYVYFWDYRNYWEKTESLHALLVAGHWRDALALFTSTYTSNYSLLPAVGPALLTLATGGPTRIGYALAITALYAVPAYLMVCLLGRRWLDRHGADHPQAAGQEGVLAAFPVLAGLPAFFGTTLYLMPDIGGVVLVVAALLTASTLVDAIAQPGGQESPWRPSGALFRSSVSLGLLLAVMFVFRRWYAFSAAGIGISVALLVLLAVWRAGGLRRVLLSRALASVVLIAFSAMPLLGWFIFAWSNDPGQHDYARLYSSYRVTLAQDVLVFAQLFGVAAPLLCIASALWVFRRGKDRPLFFLVTVSTLLAVLMFLAVQSPGRHHYYLLMPLMGSLLAVLSLRISRRFGLVGVAGLTLLLAGGGWLATRPAGEAPRVALFAGYQDIRPRQQEHADSLIALTRWLERPENRSSRFCLVASSVEINQGMFRQLWQITPEIGRDAYAQRMVRLGQVDSIDGPPVPGLRECGIFLVGVPFQFHLRRDQQFSMEIIQQDLVTGSGIGSAVSRDPEVFRFGDGVEIRAYRTVRQISGQEYDALVQRYLQHKATPAQALPPAAGVPSGDR